MNVPRPTARNARNAAAAAAALAGAVGLRALQNRRRVARDPAREALVAPLGGRQLWIEAPDGTRLNARVFGPEDAPTVVLGHGWVCAMRFWKLQIPELARHHRVVAWELRGHGESESPRDHDYSIETLADDLDAVLAATLREGERALVAGHSLGAMTLVAWAGRNPDRVRERLAAAALINTGVGGLIAEALVIRSPAAIEQTRDLLGRAVLATPAPLPPFPNPFTHELIRHLALGRSASPATVEFCERMVLSCGPEARARAGATMSRLDLHEHVAELSVPTLVVAGESDRLTPPVHARRLVESLPDATYVELAGVGHMALLESPSEITRALGELARTHLTQPAGASV